MKKKRSPRQRQVLDIRSIALFANPQKAKALQELSRLKTWLRKRKITPLSLNQISKADALIVLGGDGTILSVAPEAAFAGIPVFGINVGHLGFLTAVNLKKAYRALDDWLAGKWVISERMLIEVIAPRQAKSLAALNDVVVRLKNANRVTTVTASINNEKLAQFVGDGVIAATSTGSTAYSLSAQGPVVHPGVEAMILTPICAHSFSQRPVVFPSHHVLELHMSNTRDKNEVQLCLDGQRIISLKCGDRIKVRRSPYKLKLVYDPRVSYFGVLREKLHWGGR